MRRYLDAIFGNEDCCLSLGKSIEKNRLSHAILIEGPQGSGKRTLAKEIAMSSLCEHREDTNVPLPCRSCRACHLVEENLAPDVHYFSRGDRASIGVDTVREMRADTTLSATEFDCRFYIFEDAHTMTVQAQNALLKVMEEPSTNIKILLLTESADALLTTVRSRARLIRMQRFAPKEINTYLAQKQPALLSPFAGQADELFSLLLTANGSIGAAIALLTPAKSEEIRRERKEILSILYALCERDYSILANALSALPQKRDAFSKALFLLQTALRDLILLKRTDTPPFAFFPSKESVPPQIASLPIGQLFSFVDAIEDTLADLEKNANTATSLAILGCHLRSAQKER